MAKIQAVTLDIYSLQLTSPQKTGLFKNREFGYELLILKGISSYFNGLSVKVKADLTAMLFLNIL